MVVIVSGGGTGGHIYPAIAIAKEIIQMENRARIVYIGGKDRREERIVPNFGFEFISVPVESFPRSLSARWFKVAYKVPAGFIKSMFVLKELSPSVAVGTGGYVCGPVMLASALRGIPTMIQEQNAFPGLTNRILARWVDEIHVPYEKAAEFFPEEKVRITANPVRPGMAEVKDGREKFGLSMDKTTVSFVGGSQGAHSINMAMVDALKYMEDLANELQMIHQTGTSDYETVKKAYDDSPFQGVVQPYFDNIEYLYSATDLIVCRSGAMTLSEITTCGLPAILVPYPYHKDNHQKFNAEALEQKGAAIMMLDQELTGNSLSQAIRKIIKDKNRLADMTEKSHLQGQPGAAKILAEAALRLASS
ncbi:undecaprenyldiphospho-muramoylpentapeptide beta-N-acetylglucosaminyltransferase [Candidatus Poribacteria bacterium]|nr:undecaprenyldiphospho-muramoylpentapeptide beta-N-acetylglucosaminyltransferase [Candidatus Poribacteria bacterium]